QLDRRGFMAAAIAGGLLAAPLAAEGQGSKAPPDKVARVGFLSQGPESNPVLPHLRKLFQGALGESGYVEGQNLAIDYRFADRKTNRLPALVIELIGRRPAVIVANGPAALRAAKAATATVPIAAIDLESDPVAAGFVASWAKPGGNITGTFLDQAELSGKWLELLKSAIPNLSRVSALWDSTTPSDQLNALKMGAQVLTVTVHTLEI